MEGKSHRVGGVLVALGGYCLLKDKGYLLEGVNPLVQLAVIYPFSIVGALLPDQDHHEESAPMKDVISWSYCKLLHLTTKTRKRMLASGVSKRDRLYRILGVFDAKHRSWQTHSDLSFAVLILGLYNLLSNSSLTSVDATILKLITTGLVLGMLSHVFLDSITPSGVWCLFFAGINKIFGKHILPEKIRFVPKTSFFSTGGKWEEYWRKGMFIVSALVFFYIVYDSLPFKLVFH